MLWGQHPNTNRALPNFGALDVARRSPNFSVKTMPCSNFGAKIGNSPVMPKFVP